ncbi:MAG: YcnI family protein [Acidimicrobiales bacterium]|jgi:uncharacterized protein YcnI|nr:YcnI family protein [Acidimicrobiales bacterium]
MIHRFLRAVALATVPAALWASAAAAHVNASGDQQPDGVTSVTFSFSHGCAGSPTTALRIQLPDNATDAEPGAGEPGWTAEITDGVLTWSGGSIPDETKASFSAVLTLSGAAGDVVYFPTIQVCEQGQEDWIDRSDDPGADQAAPRITLTQTVEPPSTTTTVATTSTTSSTTSRPDSSPSEASSSTAPPTAASTTASDPDDEGVPTLLVIGLAVVAVAVVAGGVVMARRRPGGGDVGPPRSGPVPP